MTLPQAVSKSAFFASVSVFLVSIVLQVPATAATHLTFRPSTLQFGQVAVGASKSLSAVVTNTGYSSATVYSIASSLSAYTVNHSSLPKSLAPGQSLSLTVTFHPSSSGTDNGAVTVNRYAASLAVQGSAGSSSGGSVVANPASLAFGSVNSGSSVSASVTITNQRSNRVTLSKDAVTAPGFSVSGMSLPLTLSVGESYTFKISFSPSSAGASSGAFTATNQRGNTVLSIPLSGTGTASGQLGVSPASVSFGNVNVGSTSTKAGTLTASGSTVTISSASSNSSEFVISGITLPKTLSAGQSATYSVTFKPQSSGSATATLLFASNAADSSLTESASGTGVAATPPPTQHSVNLSWKASTSQVAGYNVYRGTKSGGPYSKLNSIVETATAYIDSTVSSSSTYYYVTTAINSSGAESSYSNQVQVTVPGN